jgi:hypothetical protein
MSYSVNTAITATFIIRDGSTAVTGLTSADFDTAEAYLATDPGTTASVTITEIGSGEYRATFTPTTDGTWTLHLVYDSGGVFKEFAGDYQVVSTVTGGTGTTIAIEGARMTSRRELRRRIADRLGDLVLLEATAESLSNSTFTDDLNISGAADNLTGRQFAVATGANAGHVARIVSSSESTNSITFTPPADTVFSPGDVLEVVNERSRGWTIAEYNRTINAAIADTWPLAAAKFAATISGEFSLDTPTIAIPDAMNEVAGVVWQDPDNDTWIPIQRTEPFYGWTADGTTETVTLRGRPGILAEGRSLRLLGYGRHPELTDDDDETALNPEWLVAECCYRLAVSGADRDGARANTILLYKQEREVLRARIRTLRPSGTVRVRG